MGSTQPRHEVLAGRAAGAVAKQEAGAGTLSP